MQVNLHITHAPDAGTLRTRVSHETEVFKALPHGYVAITVSTGDGEVVLFLSDPDDATRLRDAAGEALGHLQGIEAPVVTKTTLAYDARDEVGVEEAAAAFEAVAYFPEGFPEDHSQDRPEAITPNGTFPEYKR